MGRLIAPSTRWLVREYLAFDGYLRSLSEIAHQVQEPLFEVQEALRQLVRRGEVRRIGALYVSEESPLCV